MKLWQDMTNATVNPPELSSNVLIEELDRQVRQCQRKGNNAAIERTIAYRPGAMLCTMNDRVLTRWIPAVVQMGMLQPASSLVNDFLKEMVDEPKAHK